MTQQQRMEPQRQREPEPERDHGTWSAWSSHAPSAVPAPDAAIVAAESPETVERAVDAPAASGAVIPAYVSVGAVASEFSVHPNTVRNWEAHGVLVAVRLPGGHRRFLKSEVDALYRTVWGGAPPLVASEYITAVPAEAVEPHQGR
jgi:hypothetical protein